MVQSLLVSPRQVPFSLEEIKSFLKIDHSEDDDFLNHLLKVATQTIEETWSFSLHPQIWRATYPLSPKNEYILPKTPLQKIDSVVLRPPCTSPIPLSSEDWCLTLGDLPFLTLVFSKAFFLPKTSLEITFEAGFLSPEERPAALKHAVFLLVAHWFETRLPSAVLPTSVKECLAPWRRIRL